MGITCAVFVAFAALIPSASATPSPLSDFAPELSTFYQQDVAWQNCQGDSCARVRVPLDYSNPAGTAIALAVRVIGSRDLPSLIVNPGGPGAGGVDFARMISSAISPDVRSTYSVVGFDPRGTGNSSPITCLTGKQTNVWLRTDITPDTPREVSRLMNRAATIGQGCEKFSQNLSSHVGTTDTVRDLDILREVLGNETLNWLGFSYGTSIGARYAELFPQRVGRMVLDGAVNPALDSMQLSQGQAKGFQTSLKRFNAQFPGSIAVINKLLARLDKRPMSTSMQQALVQSEALTAIFYSMYSPTLWPDLHDAIGKAQRGDGTRLQRIAYAANDQIGPDKFSSNFLSAFYAINCWDYPAPPETQGLAGSARTWSKNTAVPEISRAMSWGNAPCTFWFDHAERAPQPVQSLTKAPIVVIGTQYDPATPLRWARELNKQMPTSDLLIYAADGHTAYLNGSRCVDEYVDAYLISGQTSGDKTCR